MGCASTSQTYRERMQAARKEEIQSALPVITLDIMVPSVDKIWKKPKMLLAMKITKVHSRIQETIGTKFLICQMAIKENARIS